MHTLKLDQLATQPQHILQSCGNDFFGFPSIVTTIISVPELHQVRYHFHNVLSGNGKVKFPFPILDYVVTMILCVVDGADVATEEGSKDVISLYSTGRRSRDAVTE